jgi:glycosyltransferase involved in cell wall biosynthesis
VPTVATVDVGVSAHRAVSDIDSLQKEVERLLENPAAHEEASRACRAYFEASHSCARVLRRYERLFDGMMR